MDNIKKEAFRKELQELLEKYNVSIATGGYGDYFEVEEIDTKESILVVNSFLLTSEQLENNCEVSATSSKQL
jgi:uncharacterized protein YlxP (DUF503 family)